MTTSKASTTRVELIKIIPPKSRLSTSQNPLTHSIHLVEAQKYN